MDINQVNWYDGSSHLSPHFTVKDALWLPTWNRLATNGDGLDDTIKTNIMRTVEMMEKIRSFLGVPINVHCLWRPLDYNAIIPGAASHSAHVEALACDFDADMGQGDLTANCNEIRRRLVPYLEQFGIRMEHREGPWVHCDLRPVVSGGNRYFIP